MKIGYPCINNRIGCTANSTFRLASYSEKRLHETVENNLRCLKKMLEYNKEHNLMFLRIGSGLVPFASHQICESDWKNKFKNEFKNIGNFIKKNKMRISVHPGQYTVINSPNERIVEDSIKEIRYHCDILDLMGLDSSAKVQIHVGGVYGDKENAIKRFIETYKKLDKNIKKRLVVENDHVSYTVKDCLLINEKTGIPIIFDTFHHTVKNNNESITEGLKLSAKTWKKKDGVPMIDYSTGNLKTKKHSKSLDIKIFNKFLQETKKIDFDIMLEIKDKEKSALKAVKLIR